jgi:hypothetical protein
MPETRYCISNDEVAEFAPAMTDNWLRVWERAALVFAALWFVSFYFANADAIQLLWQVEWSTPNSRVSTMCSDVYAAGDQRLIDCENAAPGSWVEKYLARQRGEGVPWRYYADRELDSAVGFWWFAIPIALLFSGQLFEWIVQPMSRRPAKKDKTRK